jgi:hypothetical protein
VIKINIYYWNNGVGLKNDIILLTQVLKEFDVVIYDISKEIINRKSDIGIFIQNIYETYMNDNKINILIPNEEWLSNDELIYLHNFDYIFVKSKYAKSILDQYHKNIIITGFFSLDRYFFTKNNKEILFLKGKSIQKNHELIRNYKEKINILDANHKYLNENELVYELNNHNIHICCSLYEAWGHYLWEAMSCGKLVICSEIPVFKEYLDPDLVKFIPIKAIYTSVINYEYLSNPLYKLRKGYFVDKSKFEDMLNNKEDLFEFQKNNCDNIRHHFLEVNDKNKRKLLNTIKYII